MSYEVNDGRIDTWSLEAHIVDHCNLRCAECCSLSPLLPERVTSPAELAADLARLAPVLRPQIFKLTGGEPLLHPDLLGMLETARASGIARIFSVTTNGFHAARVPVAFWKLIDRMTLSLYESAPLPPKSVARIHELCAEHDVRLTVKPYLGFQKMTPAAMHGAAETARVHESCWLRVRCHLVHRGSFYTCTRPPHLGVSSKDGVDLDTPDLQGALLEYLESSQPLESCRHCLGATGERQPHRQLIRVGVG